MDLFSYGYQQKNQGQLPLASRMRPTSLDEVIGQTHLIGAGKFLRRAIQANRLPSMIFYGPPGTGKTTLAQIIARESKAHFAQLHAVSAGVKEVRQITESARERLHMTGEQTILFMDEIHRFNRSQQDSLLNDIEEGVILFIGATTENPSFTINAALLSRVRLFPLHALRSDEIEMLIERALQDENRGLSHLQVELDEKAKKHLIHSAGGDGRNALQSLELAALTTNPDADGKRMINLEDMEESMQKKAVHYDRSGDHHYNVTSAFIKSMRGSDPDAALYYLAKMILAGEDPLFIARRIIVHAAEDIGLADPRALMVATSAAQAVQWIGLPEARIPLAEAVIYIATAPKSNATYQGISEAMKTVQQESMGSVPLHLQDAHSSRAKAQGRGNGYQYPHNYPKHYVPQQYLPDEHIGKTFYYPSDSGYEERLQKFLLWMKRD